MEDIIYEIRKDVGLGRRLKKGDMIAFFVNDIYGFISWRKMKIRQQEITIVSGTA